MWTLIEGINLVNRLEVALKLKNFHCALGGSVLHKGTSEKDLDIFVYPHSSLDDFDHWNAAELVLEQCGCKLVRTCNHKYDDKIVKEYRYMGKRIDFFFVK